MFITSRRRSFTLAEVLITLSIIGVVAAMSIPGLMNNTNKAELVNKLIKVNATLSQTTQMIKTENGGTLVGIFVGNNTTRNIYKSKMVGVKECSSAINNDCWHNDGEFYNLHGDPWPQDWYNSAGNLVSNDGVLYAFAGFNASCMAGHGDNQFQHVCGWVMVDLNEFKKPNKVGVDIHRFWVTTQGLYPFGTTGSSSTWRVCDIKSINQYNGDGCAAIVIRTKAMDYLNP